MSWKTASLFICLGGCAAVFLLRLGAQDDDNLRHGARGPTVRVSVQASDTHPLHYSWRSTDGRIESRDATTVTWKLPPGPGIHFAYVLVTNGQGGYTERRLAINTDTFSEKREAHRDEAEREDEAPGNRPNVSVTTTGNSYHGRVVAGPPDDTGHSVFIPNAHVFLRDLKTGTRYPANGAATTNLSGEYVITGLPANADASQFMVTCEVMGRLADCTPQNKSQQQTTASSASAVSATGMNNTVALNALATPATVSGTFKLADGSLCGTNSEFFNIHSTGHATLIDSSGHVLAETAEVNTSGQYSLPFDSAAAKVSLTCESAPPVTIPFQYDGSGMLPPAVLASVKAPVVINMTASLHGDLLSDPVAKFVPPPTNLPSDIAPNPNAFLSAMSGGEGDSRLGGCKYYQAVGAVQNCGPNGELIDPIDYEGWRRSVRIGEYAKNHVPTYRANFINKVDLNLARVHESISYAPAPYVDKQGHVHSQTAAVVCNHTGASDFFNPTQQDINHAVDTSIAGQNLIACVAMDYMVAPGVNNNQPFVRFLIFGPSGELLPSINLDMRNEKYVPGTCTVCHGADHLFATRFPEDGTGPADIGAHFLPYDAGNFEFANMPGLQKAQQQEAIFHLNQNVLLASPTSAESALIAGWYSTTGHVLNESYVPPSWATAPNPKAVPFYSNVVARSCRTCHTAISGMTSINGQFLITIF